VDLFESGLHIKGSPFSSSASAGGADAPSSFAYDTTATPSLSAATAGDTAYFHVQLRDALNNNVTDRYVLQATLECTFPPVF
jgi:hypothetical protein